MYRLDQGGGYLMGMGSHDIDYACALFGEPTAVCADIRTSVPERARDDGTILAVDADDTAVLLLRMADDALVTVSTTAVALGPTFRAFEAFGSEGSLTMRGALMGPGADVDIVATRVGESDRITPSPRRLRSGAELPERRATQAIRALALMLEDWLPAFEGGPTTVPTLADGHRVARVIDAARASAAGAGWVELG
jgi:predicted dehydrogenase